MEKTISQGKAFSINNAKLPIMAVASLMNSDMPIALMLKLQLMCITNIVIFQNL